MNIKAWVFPFLCIISGVVYTIRNAADGITDPLAYLISIGLVILGIVILFFRSNRT